MATISTDKNEVLKEINEAVSSMLNLVTPLDENSINKVPFEGSWTAAQLLSHVSKSIDGMAKAMSMPAKPADRDITQRIPDLKKTFLNFDLKMKSPDFIVPAEGPYNKTKSIDELTKAGEAINTSTSNANMGDLVEGLPFGPVTKLEMLHFVLYHTQRHLQQLKNICSAL